MCRDVTVDAAGGMVLFANSGSNHGSTAAGWEERRMQSRSVLRSLGPPGAVLAADGSNVSPGTQVSQHVDVTHRRPSSTKVVKAAPPVVDTIMGRRGHQSYMQFEYARSRLRFGRDLVPQGRRSTSFLPSPVEHLVLTILHSAAGSRSISALKFRVSEGKYPGSQGGL